MLLRVITEVSLSDTTDVHFEQSSKSVVGTIVVIDNGKFM